MIDELLIQLQDKAEVGIDESLVKHNTYRIGGISRYLVYPNSINDLVSVLKLLKEKNIKYFILGNGSNVILNDEYYDGAVIKLSKLCGVDINKDNNTVYAEAGCMLPKLTIDCANAGLTGLEFASGIPGTVGGSVYGNAGAYNACLMDYVDTVTVLDLENDYDIKVLEHEDITYGYRTTMFKESKKYIILAAKFYLKDGEKENSLSIMEERRMRRITSQPLEFPSAGSVFRNPEGDFAGRLIEFCGLKGEYKGGAQVSEKHANFVINRNNATSKDVYELINMIHDTVLEKTNVDLMIEQEFIGWE